MSGPEIVTDVASGLQKVVLRTEKACWRCNEARGRGATEQRTLPFSSYRFACSLTIHMRLTVIAILTVGRASVRVAGWQRAAVTVQPRLLCAPHLDQLPPLPLGRTVHDASKTVGLHGIAVGVAPAYPTEDGS